MLLSLVVVVEEEEKHYGLLIITLALVEVLAVIAQGLQLWILELIRYQLELVEVDVLHHHLTPHMVKEEVLQPLVYQPRLLQQVVEVVRVELLEVMAMLLSQLRSHCQVDLVEEMQKIPVIMWGQL
jgi:hypothetical protein